MPSRNVSAPRATAKKSTARPEAATKTARPKAVPQRAPRKLAAAPTATQPQAAVPVSHQEIQLKAFELWQRRGGDDVANWIEAETILKRERTLDTSRN